MEVRENSLGRAGGISTGLAPCARIVLTETYRAATVQPTRPFETDVPAFLYVLATIPALLSTYSRCARHRASKVTQNLKLHI